ncbi:MAG: response regulator [Candidatus Eiseniibacteriota bacterium]
MKCLLVDESSLMRRILVRALASMGHREVIEVPDGVEALQHCDESVGLVITEWRMPGMGGLDLVRHLRANPSTSRIPVIMVTSRNLRENVEEAVQAGVNGYLLKPVSSETLRRKIEEVTSGADRSAEAEAQASADGTSAGPENAPEEELRKAA